MLTVDEILFDDEIVLTQSSKISVDDVVVCHFSPTDDVNTTPKKAIDFIQNHIIPAVKVVEMQKFIAKRLGFPYKHDKHALEDYVSVHWAWLELKATCPKHPSDTDTDIIPKEAL